MPKDAARLAIEAALGDPDARLALALDVQVMSLFDWDVVGGDIYWPPGADVRFGLEPGSITNFETWARFVSTDDIDAVEAAAAEAERNHAETFHFHYRLLAPSGDRAIEGTSRCVYDESGKLIRAVGFNIDVTERLRREQVLKTREAQLQSILATVPDAMVVIDSDGSISQFSSAAEVMFGYRAQDVLGRNVAMLMPDDVATAHDGFLERYLRTGVRHVIGQTQMLNAKRRDGSLFPAAISIGEAYTDNNRVFTGFIRDMSEEVRAESERSELLEQLAHVGRTVAMGELAAGLAHELNQPLSASTNFLTAAKMLVQKDTPASRAVQFLSLASEQILRAGSIIRNLRQFIAKREVQAGIEPIEDTIREAVNLVMVGDIRFDVTVHYNFRQNVTHMFADRVQFQQVIVNLVRNAVEMEGHDSLPRRQIWIDVRSPDIDTVEIEVRDNGPGIPDEYLESMFASEVSTKGAANMDLGLSISRRIVEAHNGSITARNAAEGGAIISFTVPAAPVEG